MARRRGGARVRFAFLILGVLIAALALVGDRMAVNVAQERAAEEMQGVLGTPGRPEVTVEGFPFLTQLPRRELSSVHVVADGVTPLDRAGTALDHVDLRLHDVTGSDAYRKVHAARAEGTVAFDYASAQQLAGYPVSYRPEGLVELTMKTMVVSTPVVAKVVGRPVVNAAQQTLTLRDAKVNVLGVDLPDATAQALLSSRLKPVPLTGIPYGLSVTELTATPDGLVASVTGSNLTFSR